MKALKHLCELYFCMSALLFPLNTLSQVREVTTEEFSFRIERSGEATLIKAQPTPGYLNFVKDVCTIPETVEVDGQTHSVTRIADDAFKWSAVKKIIVPACIKDIGKNAFQSSLLSEIELPESPLTLNTEAFRGSRIKELRIPAQTKLEYTEFQGCLPETPQLQNILVEEGHPDLMDVDGVLCTKDGCLLAYPSARTGTYVTRILRHQLSITTYQCEVEQ